MAATSTCTMNVTLTYTDYNTRTYKLPFDTPPSSHEDIEASRTAIRNFNTAAQTEGSTVRQTFLSDNGAPVASINDAVVVFRTEEEIYSG